MHKSTFPVQIYTYTGTIYAIHKQWIQVKEPQSSNIYFLPIILGKILQVW